MGSASRTVFSLKESPELGTGIVKALSHQLDAQFATAAGPKGTTVSVTHATFPAKAARTPQMA